MMRPLLAILAVLSFASAANAVDPYTKRFAVNLSDDGSDNGHNGDSKDTAPIGGEPSLTDYGFRSDAFDAPDGSFVRQPDTEGLPNSSQCIDIYNDNSDAMDGYYDWFIMEEICT